MPKFDERSEQSDYSEVEEWPSFGDLFPALVESNGLAISQGSTNYTKRMKSGLAEYTGHPETFLDPQREFELAEAIQAGRLASEVLVELNGEVDASTHGLQETAKRGIVARDELIVCNLRYAAHLARRSMNMGQVSKTSAKYKGPSSKIDGAYADITNLRSSSASLDDRIQIANEGLILAAESFKPMLSPKTGRPVKFTTYAVWLIHRHLERTIHETEDLVRIPEHAHQEMQTAAKNPSEFTPEKLAFHAFSRSMNERISLDAVETGFNNGEEQDDDWSPVEDYTVADVLAQDEAPDLADVMGIRKRSELIEAMLDTLSERERSVIVHRFGLYDDSPWTLDQIGDDLGVTRERIRQIESKAMAKLRHPSRSEALRDYDYDAQGNGSLSFSTLGERAEGFGHLRTPMDHEINLSVVGRTEPVQTNRSPRSWQLTDDEQWDMPMRVEAEAMPDRQVMAIIEGILRDQADTIFAALEEDQTISYSADTIKELREILGTSLRPYHIEEMWNTNLPDLLTDLVARGVIISPEKLSLFFSRLLVETLHDEDVVTLKVPDLFDGTLPYFGYGLSHGEVQVEGNLGDHAGEAMGSLSTLRVSGSVGDYAGAHASGFARLFVSGNSGKHFAYGATGEIEFICDGIVESTSPSLSLSGEVHVGRVAHPTPTLLKVHDHITVGGIR